MSLNNIKLLLGLTDDSKDGLLQLLLQQATDQVLAYTNRSDLIAELSSVCDRLTVIFYNRMGAEGEQSRSEGAISQTFETLPADLIATMNRYRKVGVLCDFGRKT